MRLGPIDWAASASGPIVRTLAPRRRRTSDSTASAPVTAARTKPVGEVSANAALAATLRHSTSVSRPAGAVSRLVSDHTPPSTYSRPPMVTGAKIHGTAHDAATASPTVARGECGRPKTTRRPVWRSTVHTRRRPSKLAPHPSTLRRSAARLRVPTGPRASTNDRARAPTGAPSASAGAASGALAAQAARSAPSATAVTAPPDRHRPASSNPAEPPRGRALPRGPRGERAGDNDPPTVRP